MAHRLQGRAEVGISYPFSSHLCCQGWLISYWFGPGSQQSSGLVVERRGGRITPLNPTAGAVRRPPARAMPRFWGVATCHERVNCLLVPCGLGHGTRGLV